MTASRPAPVFDEVQGEIVMRPVRLPNLEDQPTDAFRVHAKNGGLDLNPAPLFPVVVAHGEEAAAAGSEAGMELSERLPQIIIGQQVRDGIVAGDHQVELTPPVGRERRAHIGDGEIQGEATEGRLPAGAFHLGLG